MADIDKLFLPERGDEYIKRRKLAHKAFQGQESTPKWVWAFLTYNLRECRFTSGFDPEPDPPVDNQHLEAAIASGLKLVEEIEDEELRLAMDRISALTTVTYHLEKEPSEAWLTRAAELLARYKAVIDGSFAEYEDEALWTASTTKRTPG